MGLGDTFAFYQYQSDDTTNYGLKLSAAVASQGGFTTVVDPTQVAIWPYGPKNVRHVLGKDGAGHRTRLPIVANDNSKYTVGGTFTLGSRTYTIEGIIGEKRKLNSVA